MKNPRVLLYWCTTWQSTSYVQDHLAVRDRKDVMLKLGYWVIQIMITLDTCLTNLVVKAKLAVYSIMKRCHGVALVSSYSNFGPFPRDYYLNPLGLILYLIRRTS